MDGLLERIKERVSDRNSPIRTVKALATAIGMSEAGFYVMIKKDNIKYGTLLAMSKALDVNESYLTGDEINEGRAKLFHSGDTAITQINQAIFEMKQVFEEELKAKNHQIESKDQQINNLQEMLKTVLGKFERVINEPLFAKLGEFQQAEARYSFTLLNDVAQSLLVVN